MELRIEGTDLPGCGDLLVGVQRRGRPHEVLEPRPGDADTVSWRVECALTSRADGPDLTGPYAEGRPGGRFVYLTWGTRDGEPGRRS